MSAPSPPYPVPAVLKDVLIGRANRLASGNFPESWTDLHGHLVRIANMETVPDRFVLDLAIMASRAAHAFDLDGSENFVFQNEFRSAMFLDTYMSYGNTYLKFADTTLVDALGQGRPLTQQEKEKFKKTHQIARQDAGPLLSGDEMEAFLDTQVVRILSLPTRDTRFHGISSFDGTHVYLAQDCDDITLVHELEHNIRRFMWKRAAQSRRNWSLPQRIQACGSMVYNAGLVSSWKPASGQHLTNPSFHPSRRGGQHGPFARDGVLWHTAEQISGLLRGFTNVWSTIKVGAASKFCVARRIEYGRRFGTSVATSHGDPWQPLGGKVFQSWFSDIASRQWRSRSPGGWRGSLLARRLAFPTRRSRGRAAASATAPVRSCTR